MGGNSPLVCPPTLVDGLGTLPPPPQSSANANAPRLATRKIRFCTTMPSDKRTQRSNKRFWSATPEVHLIQSSVRTGAAQKLEPTAIRKGDYGLVFPSTRGTAGR